MERSALPVVVIGAGPVGLAAAAHLLEQGQEPLVFERGSQVGASIRAWGHVRLFSPWQYAIDAAAARLLDASGWEAPAGDEYPTGGELVERYLEPLAALPAISSRLRLGHRVVAVTRDGLDKMTSAGRDEAPFLVTVETEGGAREQVLAKAVVDASGTWLSPNPLGAAGVPVIGEDALKDRIAYGIPDVLGRDRARYAGKRVLVVGSGHSAFNVLIDLVDLSAEAPGASIVWAVRRSGARLSQLFGGGINDALPARGELGARVRALVERGQLRLVTGFRAARLTETDEGILVAGQDEVLPPVDEIIVATGFRPDFSILSEVRLGLDPAVESPTALAPLIDPNVHSCGTVRPHGADELKHPDADLYVVGMKSYGRAPTFLMLTGYEQVRSVAAAIAGDWDAAREVQLVLPETGVCSTNILAERGVACCGASAEAADKSAAPGLPVAACCGDTPTDTAGSCCDNAAPRVIQLSALTKGACCS
jgi:thioredoxin reductase